MNTHPNRTTRRGFTLIELIVTIVILGILAALAVPAFSAVIERSRKNSIEQTSLAMSRELVALAAYDNEFPDEGADNGTKVQRIQRMVGEVSPTYDYAINEQTIGADTFDIGATWVTYLDGYLVNLSPFSPSPIANGDLWVVEDANDNGTADDGERCLLLHLPDSAASGTIDASVDGDSAMSGGSCVA